MKVIEATTVEQTTIYITELDRQRLEKLIELAGAMLGYRVGSLIEWEVPSGRRRLKVEELIYQPEAAGDYNL